MRCQIHADQHLSWGAVGDRVPQSLPDDHEGLVDDGDRRPALVEVDVRLRGNGDQSWAAGTVIDETFMIIREALRNAITHGAPRQVLIRVDLAPHELRARIDDDGRGFDTRSNATART